MGLRPQDPNPLVFLQGHISCGVEKATAGPSGESTPFYFPYHPVHSTRQTRPWNQNPYHQ